jgi:anti-sigma regulatory factor (Ser/Thr protein kinase)
MPTTSISLRNSFSELPRLTAETESFLGTAGAPPSVIQTADLVLEEVVTNIIKYGFDDGAEHRIEISLGLENSELAISVTDEGKEFNPLAAPEPDLTAPIEERGIGGLGVLLVRRLMDTVEYRREGNKNILLMRKKPGAE